MPGATAVEEVFDGVLNTVGLVSPRSRRIAAYAGAGLLGAAGVVEWPAAAAGAAAVWLTQARPTRADDSAAAQTPSATAGVTRRATAKSSAKKRAVGKPGTAGKAAAGTRKATRSAQRRAKAGSSASTAGG
ncbi:hypothetical protein [Streptomyces alanosinicus]|uniref:Uncharacterized protein n=1 Tax=Streptomyces alanosinicus TaxID=68171 RepID=A0A919D1H6_9ACTN|nr:hypothetical protein [Streptomyces alanosinicus]GHD98481.1 hypothetical protein GCM10010339_05830 [Streptomyces alanosinicus]